MQLSYRGFEQLKGVRRFKIVDLSAKPERLFFFTADLGLLAKHRITLQELPGLCFDLLTLASKDGEESVAKFSDYVLVPDDLALFTAPRRAQALARASKQPSHVNRPKPSPEHQPFRFAAAAGSTERT